MNNGSPPPALEPLSPSQLKLMAAADAEAIVKQWVGYMAPQGLASCLFRADIPANDGGFILVGCIDEALQRMGYALVSHSTAPFSQQANGVLMLLFTCLVRRVGAVPSPILSA